MKNITKSSRLAIIGAGISGMSLAICLNLHGFKDIQIFQKDQSFYSRRQGYGLTILQGKTALKHLGVFDLLKQYNTRSKVHYTFDSKGDILGLYGTMLWDHKNSFKSIKQKEKGLSMHIPRQTLRKVLIDRYLQLNNNKDDSLGQKRISWDHGLKDIDFHPNEIKLTFNNGVSHLCDYIIGCDGIYSNVRQLSSTALSQSLTFLGTILVLGLCHSSHPLTNETVFQTRNGVYRFYSMPFLPFTEELNTMWQLSFLIEEDQAMKFKANPEQLKELLVRDFKEWHEPVPSMIEKTSMDNLMVIPAYDRGIKVPDLKDSRVVLLGDSIHPMIPFKSQGANQALLNSIYVGQAIEQGESISNINNKVMSRTTNKIMMSRQRIKSYHSKQYHDLEQYIYPPIDKKLILTLQDRKINANTPSLEQRIIQVIKELKY